jgi:hypothetical protein
MEGYFFPDFFLPALFAPARSEPATLLTVLFLLVRSSLLALLASTFDVVIKSSFSAEMDDCIPKQTLKDNSTSS